MVKTPSIKVIFTNADQFSHAKKEQRIITERPMLVALGEVKPQNGRDISEIDLV